MQKELNLTKEIKELIKAYKAKVKELKRGG